MTNFISNKNLHYLNPIKNKLPKLSIFIHKFDLLFVTKDKVGNLSLDQTGGSQIEEKISNWEKYIIRFEPEHHS